MTTSIRADSDLTASSLAKGLCAYSFYEKSLTACLAPNVLPSFPFLIDDNSNNYRLTWRDNNRSPAYFVGSLPGSLLFSPSFGLGALVLSGAGITAALFAPRANIDSINETVSVESAGDNTDTDGSDTDGSDTDGSDTDESGTDGSGTDGSGTDGSGTDGSDTDGSDTDGSDTDGSGTDGSDTDGSGTDGSDTDGSGTDNPDFEPISPEVYRTSEYLSNATAFDMIGLDRALSNASTLSAQFGVGYAGEGITIAIIDTGVDITHSDLNDNAITDCTGPCGIHYGNYDVSGHGSHVAGIAAAEKDGNGMHGIAYNARILSGCANFSESCQPSQSPDTSTLLAWAASSGANIANMSYGLPHIEGGEEVRTMVATDALGANPDYSRSFLKSSAYLMFGAEGSGSYDNAASAFEQGLVAVVAAGNHKFGAGNNVIETTQPGVHALAPLIYENTDLSQHLNKQWLAVVNIANDQSLSTSHACGDAQAFCLAAPGTSIYSTVPNNKYGRQTGTSMATPVVSGAVAFVMSAFPSLKLPDSDPQTAICNENSASFNPSQCLSKAAVNRILVTATDIGDVGMDAIYGRGLLNLDAATSLIGQAQIATLTGQYYNLQESKLSLSPTMGQKLANVLSSVNIAAMDSYDQAGFMYQGTALLDLASEQKVKVNSMEYLNRSLKPASNSLIAAGGALRLTQKINRMYPHNSLVITQYRLRFNGTDQSQLEITTEFNPKSDFTMNTINESERSSISISNAFHSPYSLFNQKAKGVKYRLPLSGGYTIESGFFQSQSVKTLSNEPSALDTMSMIMQINSPIYKDLAGRKLAATFQVGSLIEDNSLLGSSGSGIWQFSEGSESVITGLNMHYQINNAHLLFSYMHSHTKTDQESGLFQGSKSFTGNSFSFGLLSDLNESLQYSLTLSQPLRLTKGTATLDLPTGFSGSGPSFNRYSIDLEPQGRHLEYELSLGWTVDFLGSINMNILRIEDYGNIQGNNDTMLLISTEMKF
ncbi:MAG: S8 family serine peptidase [Endozoicomonas sp. (ex Botrylloides leachii)]|nr:S8 family serine peptidase [Endozoicomonas sp. (ex Botrylloides leachii)]